MNDAAEEHEFLKLTLKIAKERGFSCASYKDRCLKRRIAVRMRARSVHTYGDYSALLDTDPGEYELLLQALTINVTKFFRNPEVYECLAREVVPKLWQLPDPAIKVWSAGCASGEEPYSLAILFHRYLASRREVDRLSRVRILGTDIDPPSLQAAQRAQYLESAFADTSPELRAAYFSSGLPAALRPEIQSMVELRRSDLFSDDALLAPFHLIVCRNVIIYFDRDSQEALFERFHRMLAPGGFLVLGKVETLLGGSRNLFVPVDARERVFRKK